MTTLPNSALAVLVARIKSNGLLARLDVKMKKFLLVIFTFIFSMFAVGCEIVIEPHYNSAPSNASSSPYFPIGKLYVDVSILDENEKHLFNCSATKVYRLELNKDYYIKLDVGPGARFVHYENSCVDHNDQEVFVREMSEKYAGEVYLLRGLKKGQSELIVKVTKNKLTGETIQKKILVEFTLGN